LLLLERDIIQTKLGATEAIDHPANETTPHRGCRTAHGSRSGQARGRAHDEALRSSSRPDHRLVLSTTSCWRRASTAARNAALHRAARHIEAVEPTELGLAQRGGAASHPSTSPPPWSTELDPNEPCRRRPPHDHFRRALPGVTLAPAPRHAGHKATGRRIRLIGEPRNPGRIAAQAPPASQAQAGTSRSAPVALHQILHAVEHSQRPRVGPQILGVEVAVNIGSGSAPRRGRPPLRFTSSGIPMGCATVTNVWRNHVRAKNQNPTRRGCATSASTGAVAQRAADLPGPQVDEHIVGAISPYSSAM